MIGVLRRPANGLRAARLPRGALRVGPAEHPRGVGLIYELLRGIVARRMSAKSIDGPIRIAQLSGDAAREGAYTYINLMAAVSLNLAIINLLPIPVLDGGVILLLLFEMLIRRDLSMPVKEMVFKFGFVFLLMVMVFVIYNDIAKMLPADRRRAALTGPASRGRLCISRSGCSSRSGRAGRSIPAGP